MSTWYDVYCVDCKDSLCIREDRWEKECATLIQYRDVIASMAHAMDVLGNLSVPFWAGITVRIGDHTRLDTGWFLKHQGHALAVIDEYGRFYEECNKRFSCCADCTSEWHYCRRRAGHEGDCSGKREGS